VNGRWWLTSAMSKSYEKGVEASVADSFYRLWRERGCWWSCLSVSGAGELLDRLDHNTMGIPCPGSLAGGPRSMFETWHEPEMIWAALFTNLAHSDDFLIFPKLN
jgi:hypothetical protein